MNRYKLYKNDKHVATLTAESVKDAWNSYREYGGRILISDRLTAERIEG